jgi:hypothetical protein
MRLSGFAAIGFAVFSSFVAFAQTNTTVVTPGGTANAVPKFSDTASITPSAISEVNGNVGVGTATPAFTLDVNGAARIAGTNAINFLDPGQSIRFDPDLQSLHYDSWSNHTFSIQSSEKLRIASSGNVGIGTTTPATTLEVNGVITVSGDGGGIYFPNYTTKQTMPWTGSLNGEDYADSVDVSGERKQYEPGDVLVIDTNATRRFVKSSRPYSTLAAGVYSTKPGVVGRRNPDQASQAAEVPLAMVGIVPTKVSAENGPIAAGDLLVTSSTPGHAMKGTDGTRLTGAVLGKALGSLPSGTGVIEVLVSLQ